ncbi:MAG: Yip1 family protein [Gemmatimonadaceae bacterium]
MSESDPISAANEAPAPPKKAALWEDFIDIFYAPSDVFARRANSGFGIPMLVVVVLIGLIFYASRGLMQPIMDAEFTRSMAKQSAKMTPEQLQMARSMNEKFAIIGIAVVMPILLFLLGLTTWVVGKFFDAKETLGAALMIACYAYFPKVVESVINAVQLLVLDPSSMNGRFRLSLGLGRFVDPDTASPVLLAALGRLDVFTIWVTILIGIGLSVTGKIPRSKAMIAAVVIWFVGALPTMLGALRQ